jgi:hypothetical protein
MSIRYILMLMQEPTIEMHKGARHYLQRPHVESATLLIEAGAEINVQDNFSF